MEAHTGDNKIAITTKPKTFHFDLAKNAGQNLKHEVGSIIKRNQFLTEQRIRNKINQLLSKYKQGKDIHEHGKQHKFVIKL